MLDSPPHSTGEGQCGYGQAGRVARPRGGRVGIAGEGAARGDRGSGPGVGAIAPDFTLPGATRYGLAQGPVRLSDYRGQTVVLAFFYKARTKG